MKILMLSDNYIPEMNANARIFSEIAQLWAAHGQDVSVITSHPNFPRGKIFNGFRNKWFTKETINKVNVIRVKTYMYPNKGLIRRSLDFLSFGMSSFISGFFQPKQNIIVAITPQFFCALSGCCLAILKKTPFVLILCDLWPDSVVANGIIKKNWLYKLIKKVECWIYHRATSIIILSEHFHGYLTQLGIDEKKIVTSIAGANKSFYPREKNQDILNHYRLTKKFVIGYIGTFGISHNHEDIIAIAKSLNDAGIQDIHFFMIGDGAKRQLLEKLQPELDNITIDGPFPGDLIPEYWSVIDLAIVPLALIETNKTVLPSKILEAMAMGIPILLYAPDGEAKKFLSRSNSGWYVQSGEQTALKELILTLASNRHLVYEQLNPAVIFAQNFTREQQAESLLDNFVSICSKMSYEKI